jgi:hypothetical protein
MYEANRKDSGVEVDVRSVALRRAGGGGGGGGGGGWSGKL